MNSLRKHFGYANVVATLALVFAMSGGALAANRYLINSTKQINPKVLKKLKGNVGKTGAQGLSGPKGEQGVKGEPGAKGETGPKGEAGISALSALPSGKAESGQFGVRADKGTGFLYDAVTLPVPLAEEIPETQTVYNEAGKASEHCSGIGHADKGFLCVYSGNREGLEVPSVRNAA